MARAAVIQRFGVRATDGRRSCVWNVWKSQSDYEGRRGDDVYLAVRQMAAHAKISAHGSGQCQFSLTSHTRPAQGIAERRQDGRHMVRWTRPVPASPAALVARIIIPESELRHLPEPRKPVKWLVAPSADHYSEIQLWLSTMPAEQEQRALDDANQQLVLAEPLTLERLLLMHRQRLVRDDYRQGLAASRDRIRAALGARSEAPGLRGVTYFTEPQDDGSHAFVEMAVSD